jgi:nicotinamidase-related amidase
MWELQPGMALVVVDVQRGFEDAVWGSRDNPGCERNIERLLEVWRDQRWPVVLVRHDSLMPGSPLAPGQAGNSFKPVITGEPDLLVVKHVNSAFYGEPDLHAWLQQREICGVVICGITTNHCCETTARMAGNLGYRTWFVLDATHTFDRRALDGKWISADALARTTAANLQDEFATVIATADLLALATGGSAGAREVAC